MAQRKRTHLVPMEDSGLIPGSGIALSCGVGCRCGSDLALLWLWYRLAAVAPIQSLAWELSYALGAALKRQKKIKKNFFFIMVYFQCCTNFCRVTQSYMYLHFLSCIIFHPVLSQETGPKNSHFVDLCVGPVMLNSMCTEQIIHALGISQIKLFFKLQRTGLIYCSSF